MIYFVRHGEAAASWGEHPDPGLSDKGWIQAEAVAKRLIAMDISAALTSPMARCQETASAYADVSGKVLTIEPCVTEIPTPDDVEDRRTWLRNLMAGDWETVPDLVQSWRRDLLKTVAALPDNTVVFSHFIAINAIVGHLTGASAVTVFRPNYCSITVLERNGTDLALVEQGDSLDTRVL
ncbi:MAG: histidine phosphatase family protein [Hyphomonas sp.]|nr:histidine phosphatase family protein [Hyphomonas sp.]